MMDTAFQIGVQKRNWTLTEAAFQRLLSWLDEGTDSGGEKFLEMRRRLVGYFDRKNCLNADELADESLNRVARRLEEEGTIQSETPAKYCYIVARFVFMEQLRNVKRQHLIAAEIEREHTIETQRADVAELRERQLDCLEQCTGKLDPVSREIIMRYYIGRERAKIENRRSLAGSLSITMNALSIRACRIREKLEACVRQCASEPK
jgi:DNA-directed RNA polymerase specialized sigma24 family protein